MTVKKLIEPTISLGTIVEIATIVFLVGAAYTRLDTQQSNIMQQHSAIKADLEEIRHQYVRADITLERNRWTDERLEDIRMRLLRIERAVK